MIYPLITLPLPPSVNSLYEGGSKQKRFPSKRYKTWLAVCPRLPMHNLANVKLRYDFYMPDNRARDCANLEKAITDFLVKQGVIIDDSWQYILEMTLRAMGIDKKNPRVEITIEDKK